MSAWKKHISENISVFSEACFVIQCDDFAHILYIQFDQKINQTHLRYDITMEHVLTPGDAYMRQ